MTSNTLNFSQRDYEKMHHLETFATPEKTIAEFQPRFWRSKEYVVAILRKTGKKDKKREYYEPVYRSTNFDKSKFVYDNVHVLEIWYPQKRKNLLKLQIRKDENVVKVLVLESDFELQEDKRRTIAKGKELNSVNVLNRVNSLDTSETIVVMDEKFNLKVVKDDGELYGF